MTAAATKIQAPSHSQYNKVVHLRIIEGGDLSNIIEKFTFPINPEEFTFTRPDRVQVSQTLGDPFIDCFGLGVGTINIRGITGWHTFPGIDNIDGFEAYRRLHRDIHDKFFELRKKRFEDGQDPDQISLALINGVDDQAFLTIPMEFKLLRSKSRPLLYQYDLNFTVIDDLTEKLKGTIDDILSSDVKWTDALSERAPKLVSMVNDSKTLLEQVEGVYEKVKTTFSPLFDEVSDFIEQGAQVLITVSKGAGVVTGILNSVADVVRSALYSVQKIHYAVERIPIEAMVAMNTLNAVLHEFTCYLSKGAQEFWLPDYGPIYGVTDCGSTRGVKSGEIATASGTNGVEWFVNMAASASGADTTTLVEYTGEGQKVVAPVAISSEIDHSLLALQNVSHNATTLKDSYEIADRILEVFSNISVDASKISTQEEASEHLTKLDQIKTVVVAEGESLQSIALRELGDATRWNEIAAINNIIVENPVKIYFPKASFIITTGNLMPGTNYIDKGAPFLSSQIAVGCLLKIVDVNGKSQKLTVESIEGTVAYFRETFSQTFYGPIRATRYDNQANFGIYDYETTLSAEAVAGSNTLQMTTCKDIYPNFVLALRDASRTQVVTVKSVSYLDKTVQITTGCNGFASGTRVRIYDTENRLSHLEPGGSLKIPINSTLKTSQNYDEIFGIDFELDEDGYLTLDGGDLNAVSGLDNLKQAIRHRIICPYKSIIVHPTYGCALLGVIGEKNTPYVNTLARATVVQAMNMEPRLNRITKFQAETGNDSISIGLTAEVVNENTEVDLNFVI